MLLFAIEGYGKEADVETDTNAIIVNDLDPSADSTISDPGSGTEKNTKSSMFFPVDQLHEVIREERIASLLEINKQRKETLGYLTQERQAVLNELKEELKRITDLIESERSTTLVELEEIGQSIADNTIMNSKQLIDHIFFRMLQFVAAMIISLLIFVLIIYGIMIKRKKQS
jgi:hypothetical protein